MAVKPLTQRELRKMRDEQKDGKEDYLVLQNRSRQLIVLQVVQQPKSGKKLDFYWAQQQVQLHPNKVVKIPKRIAIMDQIENLCKKGYIRILSNGS